MTCKYTIKKYFYV